MNAPNVRSVTVRLNAEVAKYRADIKAAGRDTEQAFDRAHASIGRVNDDLATTNTQLREYRTKSTQAARDTDRLTTSMGKLHTTTNLIPPGMRQVDVSSTQMGRNLERTGNLIDRTSGRLQLLLKGFAAVGPGLIPVGAVGIAGLAGLASQLGFAAVGITSLVVASRGLGDALKAVEKARLEPTVDNLVAAQKAMAQLGPHAQAFVGHFQELRPVLAAIRDEAAAGWFPGLIEAMDHFEDVAPRVGQLFKVVGETGGDLVADAAESLAGPEWADFLTFIEREAPGALEDLGHTAGNLVEGMAQLWMAFSPVNNDFSDWLLDQSQSFEDWASNLSKTEGFKEFVAYLRENGPKVADAAAAIGDALLQIVEAAAPFGGPVLDAITQIFDLIAKIADSPLGTPIMGVVTAISAMSLVSKGAAFGLGRVETGLAGVGIQGPRASRGLALVHKSLLAIAGIEIGRALLQGITDQFADAAPRVDELTKSLKNLDDAAVVEELGGNLKDLLDSTRDKGGLDGFSQDMEAFALKADGFVDSLGIVGDGIDLFNGGTQDMQADQIRESAEALAALDEALIGVVASAGPRGAQRAFRDMARSQDLSSDETAELLNLLPGYQGALEDAGLAAGDAADHTGRYAREQRRAARETIASKRAAERLAETLKAQKDAVKEAAGVWDDYSQKVQFGTTSVEDLMRRWRRLGEASRDMSENIGEAIERGIPADIIKDVIDTLGPLEAAGALEEFANATGDEARAIREDFRFMGGGLKDFASSYDALIGLLSTGHLTVDPRGVVTGAQQGQQSIIDLSQGVSGAMLGLEQLGHTNVAPTADLDTGWFVRKHKRATNDLAEFEHLNAIASADIDTSKADGAWAHLQSMMAAANRLRATSVITTELRTVRVGNDTAGGPIEPRAGADGMTVPGPRYPYRDSVLAWLAPTEEVITNRRGEADRFRRDRAAGRIPAYDGGGTVGADPVILTRGGDNEVERESRRTAQGLKHLRNELREAEKAVEKERRQRDALVDRMEEIESSITSNLTTELGADASADPWSSQHAGGTLAGNLATIRGDTREAQRIRRLERILQEKGFDGAALADVLARGDINEIRDYAGSSRRELARFERAFAERARTIRLASEKGADAALGDRLDTANDELRDANRELRQIKHRLEVANKDRKDEHQKDRDANRRGRADERRDGRGSR